MHSGIYTLNSKSPRDRSMKARTRFVADEIINLLNTIAEVAHEEGWDGRELVMGSALAYRDMCNGLGMNAEAAIGVMTGMGPMGEDGNLRRRGIPLLVSPEGRPLVAPPKLTKIK